jgi:PhzF family phenazine biosynthesis protein
MTPLPFFQVDAFVDAEARSHAGGMASTGAFTGNPAAVMPLTEWLPDELMQAIAAENNLSETAFTVPTERDDADYDLRWFTPTTEVPLCGHATFAAAHILIHGEAVRFSTKSGILTVTRDGDMLQMDLPAFTVRPGDYPGLLEALGVEQAEIIVGEGAEPAVLVLLENETAVRSVRPDFRALAALKVFLGIVTAPGDEQDIASRVFCPSVGIDEDPVTGAAHAALVPFWAERLGRTHFTALQASKRTGILHCELRGDRVILGGHCVTVIEGHFQI